MTFQDQYRGNAEVLEAMAESLHSNCYEACGQQSNDLTFLSLSEGLCFRNCLTKFGVFFPTLRQNLQSAEYQHITKRNLERASAKNPKIKQALADPWENEREKLMGDFMQRKPAFY